MLKNFTITRLFFLLLCLVTASIADAGTFYWVNNGGNWNDAHHWATVSGGKGGAGIPTSGDDVIFDANSFDNAGEVISITGAAACHSMNWTDDVSYPTFEGSSIASLNIYGSLSIPYIVDMQFEGSIHFKSSQNGNTINTAGRELPNAIYFEGNGSWQLNSPLILSSTLCISSGEMDANGNEIACNTLKIDGYAKKNDQCK